MLFKQFSNVLEHHNLSLKKGEKLFNQGGSVKNIYFIKKGKVKLIRNTIDGFPVTLHIAQKDESIAEASLFSDQYHCTALVDSDCELSYVNKRKLLTYLKENPASMMDLLSELSNQVRKLRSINEIKNIRSANERILSFIRSNVNTNKELKLEIPLKDIAHNLGLAHETFYRELKKLEESGILRRNTNFIKLL